MSEQLQIPVDAAPDPDAQRAWAGLRGEIEGNERALKALEASYRRLGQTQANVQRGTERLFRGFAFDLLNAGLRTTVSMFELLGRGGEDVGDRIAAAFARMLRSVLSNLMAEAAVRAAMEAAAGWASLGLGPFGAGPAAAHFAAAKMYAAIAAGSFVAAAGSSYAAGVASRSDEGAESGRRSTGVRVETGRYQHGSPYVPATGLYILEQGERVVPRGANTTNNYSGGNVEVHVHAMDAAGFTPAVLMRIADVVRRNVTLPDGSSARSAVRG